MEEAPSYEEAVWASHGEKNEDRKVDGIPSDPTVGALLLANVGVDPDGNTVDLETSGEREEGEDGSVEGATDK